MSHHLPSSTSTSIDQLQYVTSTYTTTPSTNQKFNHKTKQDDTMTSYTSLNPHSTSSSSSSLLSYIPYLSSLNQYFDFDEWEVKQRLLHAMTPFSSTPLYSSTAHSILPTTDSVNADDSEDILSHTRIDLYTPFWVTYTNILLIAATSNLSSYMSYIRQHPLSDNASESDSDTIPSDDNTIPWAYNFHTVTFITTLLNLYFFLLPFILYLAIKHFSLTLPVAARSSSTGLLPYLTSILGYSLIYLIPTSFILLIQNTMIQYTALLLCWISSSYFLIRNLYLATPPDTQTNLDEANNQNGSKKSTLSFIVSLVGMQGILLLIIKLQCYP